MSTATLEPPVAQTPTYVMPQVQLGQFVMMYPNTGQNEATGVVAKVLGIDRDQLHLEIGGSHEYPNMYLSCKNQVRHRSDPRMQSMNPYIVAKGCWDYTPWEKALRAELAELKATVKKLVDDLGGPVKDKKGN